MSTIGKDHAVPRRWRKGSLFLLMLLTGFALLSPHAPADEGYPKPSTGTEADFYVSWDKGNDANPGTIEKPFKTPDKAISILKTLPDPSGKIVLIRGGCYRYRDHQGNRINFGGLHGTKDAPIQIRGYPGENVILDSFEQDFDPLAIPFQMVCGWGGICVNESSHILIENFEVRGRAQCNVELLNSNHITFRFIVAYRSSKHGLFTGGSFHDLTIEACKFYENIYGSTCSHGVYISGGHWDPTLPPVRNITIRYVESYYNGRHGIQLNGRIENFTVEHCNLHHNILGGLSLIGTRKGRVQNNLIYKNNKQGVILYTYFDNAYWDPEDPESLAHWKGTHWTIENVMVQNNTIFMDDGPWYDDEWISYNPTWHAGVILVDTSGHLPPFYNIIIRNNIVYNHSKMIFNIANPEHFVGTRGFDNLCLSSNHPEAVSCEQTHLIETLEKEFPDLWHGNVVHEDPLFLNLTPTVLVDRTNQEIDFSKPPYTQFEDDFRIEENSPAWKIRAGAFLDNLALAQTEIYTSSKQQIPQGYGSQIARTILNQKVKPEVQIWFLENFHPKYTCLRARNPRDGKERICFRNGDQKVITFALLNQENAPVKVQTQLTATQQKKMEYLTVLGVAFDADLDIKILPDLEIVDDTIECLLDENSMVILVVKYNDRF